MTKKDIISVWAKMSESEVRRAKTFMWTLKEYIQEDLEGQVNKVHQDQMLNILEDLKEQLDLAEEAAEHVNFELARYGKKKGGA